jgi:hypothetical protein
MSNRWLRGYENESVHGGSGGGGPPGPAGPPGPQGPSGGSNWNVVSVTSDAALTSADAGKAFDNTGALGTVILSLPVPSAGNVFRFVVTDLYVLQIQADAGAAIWVGTNVSLLGGYIHSGERGSMIEVMAQNASMWSVTELVGTWELQ